jgi:hypothetical protein
VPRNGTTQIAQVMMEQLSLVGNLPPGFTTRRRLGLLGFPRWGRRLTRGRKAR